jgi:hypothetical protein
VDQQLTARGGRDNSDSRAVFLAQFAERLELGAVRQSVRVEYCPLLIGDDAGMANAKAFISLAKPGLTR